MTVYHGMPYVREAVRSVLDQSFKDFELLVIDDAGTDDTVACVRGFADPRIRIVSNERNLGQVPSLNRGLALARGRYLARLDQDDACHPQRLARQVARLEREPALAVVGTWMREVDARGRAHGILGQRMDDFGAYVGRLSLAGCPLCHPTIMIRRDVLVEAGGYDASFAPAEDVNLWARLAERRIQVAVIHEPLVLYRRHAGQQSRLKERAQRESMRRSQRQLLGAHCPAETLEAVSLLLAQDPEFWRRCRTPAEAARACRALRETMTRVQDGFRMSARERRSFARMIHGRVGVGVRLAPWMPQRPAWMFYLLVGGLSPLLVPQVRSALAMLMQPARRWRIA